MVQSVVQSFCQNGKSTTFMLAGKLFNQLNLHTRLEHKETFLIDPVSNKEKLLNWPFLAEDLINNPAACISKNTHVYKLYNWPFPGSGFLFYYCQCTHTLHSKEVKYQ